MEQVAIDVIGTEVLERAGHRLGDLSGQVGSRVVGQSMVLALTVRELRLQEDLSARNHSRVVCRGERPTHPGLEVMTQLVRGIDTPEARSQGELGE